MGEVVNVSFGRKTADGGKARILARRHDRIAAAHRAMSQRDDLTMDHADPADTRPSEIA